MKIGRVTATGTSAQVGLVRAALDAASRPIATLLKRDYTIEFHTPADFLVGGYIIPGSKSAKHPQGKPAWGYVVGPRLLWINAKLAAKRPEDAKYTVIHELGHAIDSDYLTPDKKAELMALMDGGPTAWKGGGYQKRPREVYADAFAEALGIVSPLDSYYGDIADADLPKLLEITFRAGPTPPPDDEPSDPLPLPDPVLEALRAELSEATRKAAIDAELIRTQDARIKAKNTKFSEGLAL